MPPLTEDDAFAGGLGDSGSTAWINRIEDNIEDLQHQWDLRIGAQIRLGLVGYLVEASRSDGTKAALKLRAPGGAMSAEAEALRCFSGRGAVRLLEADEARGAMLIELIEPGDQLGDCLSGEGVNAAVAQVLEELDRSAPTPHLVSLEQRVEIWARGLESLSIVAPLPRERFAQAADALRELSSSQESAVLLHGDLHVGNVLKSGADRWIAIDPKGLVGEPMYDAAWWLRDPPLTPEDQWVADLRRRRDQLVGQFDYDRERLLLWARSCAVVLVAARVMADMFPDAARHATCVGALDALA